MRYAVISTRLTISQIQDAVKKCGGRDIKVATASKQVFCALEPAAIDKLKTTGCIVSKVGGVKAAIMFPPIVTPPTPVAAVPVYSPEELSWATGFEELRSVFEPPLYGEGINLAIIGTGIRETHERINGRVIYRKNYTADPMRDGLDHDTGVCDIALTVAPLCNILNMKVLNDEGVGTEEEVALAIEDCISLHDTEPNIAPTIMNLSLGAPDDGNLNNPLRVACRAAIDRGIWVIASAGNGGPAPYSITCPACERYVFAAGSVSYEPFNVSEWSSRGPTLEGLTKPDSVLFGENIVMASSKSDTATIAKSGTSFATPFGSAMVTLYQEGVIRQAISKVPGAEPAGVEWYYLPPNVIIDNYLQLLSIKPADAPRGKDYDYGYGMPYGPLAYQAITPRAAVDISTMLQAVAPFMAVGMLGMVMAPMIKGLK